MLLLGGGQTCVVRWSVRAASDARRRGLATPLAATLLLNMTTGEVGSYNVGTASHAVVAFVRSPVACGVAPPTLRVFDTDQVPAGRRCGRARSSRAICSWPTTPARRFTRLSCATTTTRSVRRPTLASSRSSTTSGAVRSSVPLGVVTSSRVRACRLVVGAQPTSTTLAAGATMRGAMSLTPRALNDTDAGCASSSSSSSRCRSSRASMRAACAATRRR